MTDIASKADAVIVSFLPGNRGGEALAGIIYGDINPSAKFPISYPNSVSGQSPYNWRPIDAYERLRQDLYSYGHGLSYTTFEYSNLRISHSSLNLDERLRITVTVNNTGSRAGKEVVIFYLNDNFASISRPVKQVKI